MTNHERENYTQFKTPDEIKIIFNNIDELYNLFKDKKIKDLTSQEMRVAGILTAMQVEQTRYNSRMNKAYWEWERTRPRSQSEIESERYNSPA